ncbi:hypothetical protein K445DRAFT_11843 [Daldinia sp. EC12]|nr:hypothetical protein K445DRAFT_11843 [Daldinia sp. EC12]
MASLLGTANKGWPSDRLPVEIFTHIAKFLPDRSDLKNLRLVNKEFNKKLHDHFFERIVINVNLKLNALFNIPRPGLDDYIPANITEYLMRSDSFRSISPQVRRIGLALELSEQELASPEDDGHEAIEVREWGIFRWPATIERRAKTRIARLTQSLESARGVSYILANTKEVREIALSCDGCLGYLQGPDLNPYQPPGPPPVFGDPNVVPNTVRTTMDLSLPSLKVTFDRPYKLELMEAKLAAIGVHRNVIPLEILRLIRFEKTNMDGFTREDRWRAPLPRSRYGDIQVTRGPRDYDYRLQPDQLTETQARLLFHYITTHQALIQAFLLSVVDNSSSYTRLTKVNIARIPSLHIDLLCRDDFWSGLPSVEEVSLGVVPDWREVIEENAYTITTRQVYPTTALPKVFRLLEDYIGVQSQIKKLHFEWLCGGEFAAGWLQREKHILPAPFLRKHRLVIHSGVDNLLILPHIQHLSLKNCWFAPNVFYRIIHTMSKDFSLETLDLESVSLTGPPIFRGDMPDVDDPGYETWPMGVWPSETSPVPGLLQEPLPLSWSHVIDMLTPGETIRERVFAEKFPLDPPLRIKKELGLRKITFKSCGYVMIPDKRFVSKRRFLGLYYPLSLSQTVDQMTQRYVERWRELAGCMQVNTDRHLGYIFPLLNPREDYALQKVHGLRPGWYGTYAWHLFRAAQEDGIPGAGVGRFSGTIGDDESADFWGRGGVDGGGGVPQPYEFDTEEFDFAYEEDDLDGLHDLLQSNETRLGYSAHNNPLFPNMDDGDN